MNEPINLKKKLLLIIVISTTLIAFLPVNAQSNQVIKDEITSVFNKMVLSFGSAKAAPDLKIIFDKSLNTPALYYASPSPTILVDATLYKICLEFQSKKNSALAIIIGHELAHYYNDHTFCTDFAFAIRKKNSDFSQKLKALSKSEMMGLEVEADHKGLFYTCIAGYTPFDIYPKLLDKIYDVYNLSDYNEGYPTRQERKDISIQAQKKVSQLYKLFTDGLSALDSNEFDSAIHSFNELNKFFPSRENYNNLGVAKLLKALQNKPFSRNEYIYPKRFSYPISIDRVSRLNYNQTRSQVLVNDQNLIIELLKEAQFAFEKAISLDPSYTQSYVNIACVYDLLSNPMGAIGKILELPVEKQEIMNAQKILAIAYFNIGMEERAELIWKKLNI